MSSLSCGGSGYRLYCKRQGGNRDHCVTVRDGKLVLTLPNMCDPNQLWLKDESGKCGFMLIHKATSKAVRYCRDGEQLVLVNKPNCPDKSVIWTESGNIKDGYRYMKAQGLLGMVMDAWTGKIADGTKISIHPENKNVNSPADKNADNQLWKLHA